MESIEKDNMDEVKLETENQESTQENTQNNVSDEELEEGELKDDDDDDDEMENNGGDDLNKKTEASDDDSSSKSSSSKSSSTSSSSQTSESSNASKLKSSSRTSSRLDSHHSTSSRIHSRLPEENKISLSYRHGPDERFRGLREREDPSQRAAKLISARTRLLEMRSREIELKLQKNKGGLGLIGGGILTTPQPKLSLSNPVPTKVTKPPQSGVVKLTLTKPIISYSENPKAQEREKKSKKKSKAKKKKKSSKKHKRRKTSVSAKKSSDPSPLESLYPSLDHQGPKTPPDNNVVTIDDEQVKWPSHLIRMTTTQPSISYSINPDAIDESKQPSRRQSSHSKPVVYETDLDSDYAWYLNYFLTSLDMDQHQAQYQAFCAIISTGTYRKEDLNKWLNSRGFNHEMDVDDGPNQDDSGEVSPIVTRITRNQVNRDIDEDSTSVGVKVETESSNNVGVSHSNSKKEISLRPLKPRFTTLVTQREIVLPNGQVLPPGTVQKIVHPYPRIDSEVLGPLCDMY